MRKTPGRRVTDHPTSISATDCSIRVVKDNLSAQPYRVFDGKFAVKAFSDPDEAEAYARILIARKKARQQ